MAKFPDTDDGRLLEALAGYGVARAVVEFDGGGDSGQIQEIVVEGLADGADIGAIDLRPEHRELAGDNLTFRSYTLYGLIKAAAYKVLDRTQYDWYNNDGGWGTIKFVPGEGVIHVDMNLRYMTSKRFAFDFDVEVEPDA